MAIFVKTKQKRIALLLTAIIQLSLGINSNQALASVSTPTNLSATGNRVGDYGSGTVNLSWTAVAGASNGYAIQTTLNGVQVGDLTSILGQGTTSAVVGGLLGGSTYSFKIRAVSESALSSWSSAVTASPITSPSAPSKPTVTNAGLDVTVRWTAPASDGGAAIASYAVTEINLGVSQTVSASSLSVQFNGLTAGSKVKFNVRAINGVTAEGTASPTSDELTLPNVPNQVTGVTVTRGAGDGDIQVSWSTPGNGGSTLTGLEVFLRSGNQDIQTLQVTDIETTSAIFSSLAGGTYSVQVLGKNAIGSGPRSTEPTGVTISGVAPISGSSSGGSNSGGGGGGTSANNLENEDKQEEAKPSEETTTKKGESKKGELDFSIGQKVKKPVTILKSLPKDFPVNNLKVKVVDVNGKSIKGVKVTITKSGKVSVVFPKGSRTGNYKLTVKSKNKEVTLKLKVKK